LHPITDVEGVHRYNPVEVRGIEIRDQRKPQRHAPTQGELEAAAIDLIVQGKSKLDIVRQLALPMKEVQRIWEEAQQSFEDAAEEKRRAAVRTRHEARMREEADRKSRERIAQMRVDRAHEMADTETAKQVQKMMRSLGVKPVRARKADSESPTETETTDDAIATDE
jgi:Fe-S oxidoreductase